MQLVQKKLIIFFFLVLLIDQQQFCAFSIDFQKFDLNEFPRNFSYQIFAIFDLNVLRNVGKTAQVNSGLLLRKLFEKLENFRLATLNGDSKVQQKDFKRFFIFLNNLATTEVPIGSCCNEISNSEVFIWSDFD